MAAALPSSILAEARARHVLRASRLPYKGPLERASSTRNEIWLTERHVVRVNRTVSHRLRREAALYPHLPAAPWAPRLVTAGRADQDYLVVERRPGRPLAHCWPGLDQAQRRAAVAQLATCLRAVHATATPPDLDPLPVAPQLLDGTATPAVGPLLDGLDRLAADPNADAGVIALAQEQVTAFAADLEPFDATHLIHGDLTFENVLWDGAAISAVVDFEWCRGAPADLDLDVLLRCCAYPEAHVAAEHADRSRADDYAPVVTWLAEDYPELFAHPALVRRLWLYALAFDVREALEAPLPAVRGQVPPLHPWNRLVHQVSTGGHAILLLERAGLVNS
ncbi:MAG: aminoglycoside phosphotransferase family protein [Acidimicrobiia bacterium]|nr:aminoglycoside phosphotransferase family protein [Acidimicrobiia bacterium]